ncbi:MAG TPA: TIGR02757 family protein [Thermoanaerobaculia bacterium]|nr:TIGR02757 family protein [Thermoanaerobaculia bacterium]
MPRPLRHVRPVADGATLSARLDELVASFDISHLSPDPLEAVRDFDDPLDQETAGLIAAAFAYGRADIALRNVRWVLGRMTPSPYRFLANGLDRRRAGSIFRGFSHRFHKTAELTSLLILMSKTIRSAGSLGNRFRQVYDPADADISGTLSRFVQSILAEGPRPSTTLRYLLTDPVDGSACKRMNLYLRWMVRREEPDLGLWTFVDPAKLLMPVDTHVHRIATFLGLIDRKSADLETARQLTSRFSAMSPDDPVRYDFALCRMGVLAMCSREKKAEQCRRCLLLDVCRFPAPEAI